MPRYFTWFRSRKDERCTGVWSRRFSAPRREEPTFNLCFKGSSCPGTELSGITYKALLFVPCSGDFASVNLFFFFWQEANFHRGPSVSQTPLSATSEGSWWLSLTLPHTVFTYYSRKHCVCVFATPDIPDIVCVSHESQCLGFDREQSDQHSLSQYRRHTLIQTHTVSSFLLLSVSVVPVDAFQMNEFRSGVLPVGLWSHTLCTLTPIKSKTSAS